MSDSRTDSVRSRAVRSRLGEPSLMDSLALDASRDRRHGRPRTVLRAGRAPWLAACLATTGLIVSLGSAAQAGSAGGEPIDYVKQVQPILADHCYACHGPDMAEAGLRLSEKDSAIAAADASYGAIIPGDVDSSELLVRVTSEDEFDRMPPEGQGLSDSEIEILRAWIRQGAPWQAHWAFEPIREIDPPDVKSGAWATNPIDRFIYTRLRRAGLEPNLRADRRTLIRRAYYDLTGLPPTANEVKAFVESDDPLAYEALIDRLLNSPHYGERWGRHWLDLVRYAETNSFERDGAKPNAWKYRDYVIASFNDDKPYDQFVREQLAGDELDKVTKDSLTATGFYRLGIWDDEPADPLQAKYDELDDIITTTSQVFLGLTVNCARCHDHKIDPIPQTDYYSMLAFFADVTPYGTRGDQRTNNQIDVSPEQLKRQYATTRRERRRLESELREIEQAGIAKMSAPDQRATEGPKKEREAVLREKLRDHLTDQQWARYRKLKAELQEVTERRDALPPRETVLGLARCVADPELTRLLERGNPHTPADTVTPSFPELFAAEAPEIRDPASAASSADRRRVLADWIASPDNRLTARVMANRVWQYHFGRGIVRSSNNFGKLGTPPTHPDLLDWLATRLIEGGWKLKAMHRLIMTSEAYRMSSAGRPSGIADDPNNDLFWRFDPRRLSAEEVRDSILAVNRSLNRDVYGPSIYPKLSDEVLAGQSRPGSGWGDSAPEQRNRRSVYIHVKRSLLPPMLSAFDFPEPDRSCEARFTTLQPGQALSLLNSEFIHRQAGRLADYVDSRAASDDDVARRVIRAVLAREATADEVASGEALMDRFRREHGLPRARAAQLYCLSVLNWNEFLFVD